MRQITEIIIHCSATPEGRDYTVEDITRWHKARGFRTIGYHYVIYRDGTLHQGRPIEEPGAHCQGHNQNSIGICYIGGTYPRPLPFKEGSEMKTLPKDTRTPEQKETMRLLIEKLQRMFPKATVHGHNEFAAKACPCFCVKKELSQHCD